MKTKEEIAEILHYFRTSEGHAFEADEEAILAAYPEDQQRQSLAIKVLSVLGGILASLAFFGFLIVAGLYNSAGAMVVFGVLCITGAVWYSRLYNRIITDTLVVTFFIAGFILIGMGLDEARVKDDTIFVIFILLALAVLIIVQRYLLSFIATLICCGSCLALIISEERYDMVHVYVSALAVLLTYSILREGKIITMGKILSRLYEPVRTALIFAFLAGLFFLGMKGIVPLSREYMWQSSVFIIGSIVYLISYLIDLLKITSLSRKIMIYACSVLILMPALFAPSISGSILIILLSFCVNYKTGFVVGIVAFFYFIAQYYYDLNFTLLTKSIILFSSGGLFIVIYFFIRKSLATDEKI